MTGKSFANISQRAVSPYLRALAEFSSTLPELAESQGALHAFFKAFYTNLYEQPGLFGLPLNADISIAEDEPDAKQKKQQVKRLLDKSKGMIYAGLDFLLTASQQGKLEGQALHLSGLDALVKQTKVGRKFLAGLESVGLVIRAAGDSVMLENTRFPHMLPALQALADACTAFDSEWLGKFQFACCNFRALQGVLPDVMDLYRIFEGEEYALVMELHEYFNGRGYKALIDIRTPDTWIVKYQGNRKVKATPLYQVSYDGRYARPLRMDIKCASTKRILTLLFQQSQMLQEDFMRRAFPCNGDACGWCRNQKTLGPTVMVYKGETRTLCWFSLSDVHVINADTAQLIKEYEQMHAQLTPDGYG